MASVACRSVQRNAPASLADVADPISEAELAVALYELRQMGLIEQFQDGGVMRFRLGSEGAPE